MNYIFVDGKVYISVSHFSLFEIGTWCDRMDV
jgi:hypothetical protein